MNHFIYIGMRNKVRVFYGVESKQFYYAGKSITGSSAWISIFAFVSVILYTCVRKFNNFDFDYNETAYFVVNAVLGLSIAVFLAKGARKSEHNYFTKAQPIEITDTAELKKMLRQAGRVSVIYVFSRIFMLIAAVCGAYFVGVLNNIIIFLTYFTLWVGLGYLFIYFNLRKRRKALKEIKKNYIKYTLSC